MPANLPSWPSLNVDFLLPALLLHHCSTLIPRPIHLSRCIASTPPCHCLLIVLSIHPRPSSRPSAFQPCERMSHSFIMHLLALLALLVLQPFVSASLPSSAVIVGGADFESALAMEEILLAYQFDTGVSINMSVNIFTVNKVMVFNRSADFGIVSKSLTAAEVAANPTVDMFPFLATPYVPIYRVDGLGANAAPLVFPRLLMWAIWAGNVTWWDDPMIQSANPNATLPHQGITNVRQSACYCMNSNWVSAMQAFNPTAPADTFPNGQLNMTKFYKYRLVPGVTGVAATVVDCGR